MKSEKTRKIDANIWDYVDSLSELVNHLVVKEDNEDEIQDELVNLSFLGQKEKNSQKNQTL